MLLSSPKISFRTSTDDCWMCSDAPYNTIPTVTKIKIHNTGHVLYLCPSPHLSLSPMSLHFSIGLSVFWSIFLSPPSLFCLFWSITFIYMHRNIYCNSYVYTHAGSSRVYGMLREHRRSRNKSCTCVEARGGGRGTLC